MPSDVNAIPKKKKKLGRKEIWLQVSDVVKRRETVFHW